DRNVTGVQTCALPISAASAITCRQESARSRREIDDFDRAAAVSIIAAQIVMAAVAPHPHADAQWTALHFSRRLPANARCRDARRSEERRVGRGCGALR